MTPRSCHVYTADADTKMFSRERILVRISRQLGVRVRLVRDACKEQGLECFPVVRFVNSAGQIHLEEARLALIPGMMSMRL